MNNASTRKDKRATSRWVGETDRFMLSPKIPLQAWQPTIGRDLKNTTIFPEEQEVYPTLGTPQLFGPAPERGTTKMFGLKTNREYVQEIQRAIRMENLLAEIHSPWDQAQNQ